MTPDITHDPQFDFSLHNVVMQKAQLRLRARTDLMFLLRDVLQYKDVEESVHGELIEALQKFSPSLDDEHITATGNFKYIPKTDLWTLKGPRKRLLLYPRGHLKTTIITIGHMIQWIINYPDIRILLSMATGDQVVKVARELKAHFQYNENFRFLFPDFCPPSKHSADFGSQDSFEVPNRQRKWLKEPTISCCSVGKVVAGGHYEIVCNSDLVDKENVKTPNQIQEVISHFGYLNPLLERGPIAPHHGWTYVEGTRYDFSDLYGTIIEGEEKKKETQREWLVLRRAAIKPDGTSLWKTRFPLSELDNIRRDATIGDYLFSCQYLNDPIPTDGGLAKRDEIKFVGRPMVNGLLPYLRLHCTIDLHGMEANSNSNDYTVITVAGFDRDGRVYVVDIKRGRFTPHQVIYHIFKIHEDYPRVIDFKIEKDAHARVLLPFLYREMSKRGRYPVIVPLKRDNRTSKQNRIRGLQAWFHAGIIRFVDDLDCRLDLINEIVRFPKYAHDDILDTLTDQMQNRDSTLNYDVVPDTPPQQELGTGNPGWMRDRFLGFNDKGGEDWVYGNLHDQRDEEKQENSNYHRGTGL